MVGPSAESTKPGERFWCIVKEVQGETIEAEVDNHLVMVDWPLGKLLRFHRDCVYLLVRPNESK